MKNIVAFSLTALLFSILSLAYSYSSNAEETEFCSVAVNIDRHNQVLALNVSGKNENNESCTLDKAQTIETMSELFSSIAKSADKTEYSSLFIGALEHYEWISLYIAKRASEDANWSSDNGTTLDGKSDNSFVNNILSEDAVIGELNPSAAIAGYHFSGVDCEKVFISSDKTKDFAPKWIEKDKRLPYNAMCWLNLIKN